MMRAEQEVCRALKMHANHNVVYFVYVFLPWFFSNAKMIGSPGLTWKFRLVCWHCNNSHCKPLLFSKSQECNVP